MLFTHLINVGLRDSQKGLVLPLLEGIWKFGKVFLVVMVMAGGWGAGGGGRGSWWLMLCHVTHTTEKTPTQVPMGSLLRKT